MSGSQLILLKQRCEAGYGPANTQKPTIPPHLLRTVFSVALETINAELLRTGRWGLGTQV
jgi:hypothetical protein